MLSFFAMGLFSRKKITSVASVAINTVTDTPNTASDSMLLSVLTGGDMSADLINNYANGLGIKMRNMQKWADLNYTLGLPSGVVSTTRATDARVRDIIATEIGAATVADVTIISNISGTVDSDSLAYQFMQEQRDWDFADNLVLNPPFPSTSDVFFSDSYIKNTGQLLVIVYEDADGGFHEEEIYRPGLTGDDIWYHVSYLTAGSDVVIYWNYEVSTNVYEILNSPHNTLQADNPYFPIVPFRVHNVNQSINPASAFETSARQMLNRIGMDFHEMAKNINDNPDIQDVDHAFLYIAVPLMSEEMNTQMYLHDYFMDLEKISVYKKRNFEVWGASSNNTAPPAVNTIYIKDSTFNLDFSYTYIETVDVAADLYKVGEGKRTQQVLPRVSKTVEYTVSSGRGGDNEQTRTRELYSYEQSVVIFEQQVEPGLIKRTIVHGLYLENHIYNGHSVEANVEEAVANKSVFLIPVNVNVSMDRGIKKNDALYYDAMWLVFNSYQVTKLKWYETGIFKAIVMIVAIIITIYSLGSAAESLAAAYALGAGEVAQLLIVQVLISFAVEIAVDFAVEKLGVAAAIVLASAAALYGVGGGSGIGGGSNLLPFADQVLALVQVMVEEILEDIEELYTGMQDELDEFLSTQSDIDKEFEALEAELNAGSFELNYLDVIRLRPNVDLTESPSEFYHRAIHSGNIGIASVDAAHNYVDTMLQLPENTLITI
jgi:hypothetical protein